MKIVSTSAVLQKLPKPRICINMGSIKNRHILSCPAFGKAPFPVVAMAIAAGDASGIDGVICVNRSK